MAAFPAARAESRPGPLHVRRGCGGRAPPPKSWCGSPPKMWDAVGRGLPRFAAFRRIASR